MKALYLTDKEHEILVALLDQTEDLMSVNRLIETSIVRAIFKHAKPLYRNSESYSWPDDAVARCAS